MSNDNRISAVVSAEDVTEILGAVAAIRAKLPFLLTLSPQERRELPKMGDKSIGFDDKCRTYMGSNPEFLPGFVDLQEVNKDRELRTQLMRVYAELISLTDSVDDTLRVVASEAWMADLAYYQAVREAARRGRAGAQGIMKTCSGAFLVRQPRNPARRRLRRRPEGQYGRPIGVSAYPKGLRRMRRA